MVNFQLETHPDYPKLVEAKNAIEEIIRVANEHKRISDNMRDLFDIQSSINWSSLAPEDVSYYKLSIFVV